MEEKRIEEKYAGLFGRIAFVPDKKDRWEVFQDYFASKKNEYDCFICDLMEQHKLGLYNKLMRRFQLDAQGGLREQKASDIDFDDISFSSNGKKTYDPLVFMEALKKTVEGYAPSMDFIICLKKNYNQEAGRDAALGKMKGMTSGRSRRKEAYLGRLVSKAKEVEGRMCGSRSTEELIEAAAGEILYPYSKKDKEDIKNLLNFLDFCYLDQETGDSDNGKGVSQEAFIAVEEQGFSDIEQGEIGASASFLAQLTEGMEENWGTITYVTNKINRDILKGFLTKSILIELKLDIIPEGSKIIPEPKCGQWCQNAANCKKNKKGCRVRYDVIWKRPPYGNQQIYQLLQPKEEELYSKLLHKDYLDAALPNSNFEEVYQNPLYPNPALKKDLQEEDACFDFSDGTLAKALHKDKAQISRYRKKYENEVMPDMWKLFSQIRDSDF